MAERNHLARELHDVLAHTLAALSLQLEAFATVVDAEPGTSPKIREQLERTRQLVREGLDEARGAVQALRDDAEPLEQRLARLAEQHQAAFVTSGVVRPLAPEAVLALYRVAQEALTNVMKHATGAAASMQLAFDDDAVGLTVDNDVPATNGTVTMPRAERRRLRAARDLRDASRCSAARSRQVRSPVAGGCAPPCPLPGAAPTTPAPTHDPLAS